MKDNLRLHLDILEAQLASLTASEADDKIRLEKTKYLLQRHQKLGKLSTDPKQLASEIEQTKTEICNRKIHYAETVVLRQIKQFKKLEPLKISKRLKKNASDETKCAQINAELEYVKSMDTDKLSNDIVKRALAKHFESYEFTKTSLSSLENNIYGRIGKMEQVRNALANLVGTLGEFFEDKIAPKLDPQTEQKAPSKPLPTEDFHEFEEEEIKPPMEKENADSEEHAPQMDPFFEESVAMSEDEGMESDVDENGLPKIMQGFISGSEDDEPEPVMQPVRKNRRGQRARRKIWEQKFGQRANHVIKETQQKQHEEHVKAQKRKQKEEKQAAYKRQRLEFESKPIHPSWAAKQAQGKQPAKFEGKRMKFD